MRLTNTIVLAALTTMMALPECAKAAQRVTHQGGCSGLRVGTNDEKEVVIDASRPVARRVTGRTTLRVVGGGGLRQVSTKQTAPVSIDIVEVTATDTARRIRIIVVPSISGVVSLQAVASEGLRTVGSTIWSQEVRAGERFERELELRIDNQADAEQRLAVFASLPTVPGATAPTAVQTFVFNEKLDLGSLSSDRLLSGYYDISPTTGRIIEIPGGIKP